eukprot:TRINITY_DN26653_c0_g1_i1.p1 TRINITY_DN26653_c0_g1~~TRINITY_DN26653_c0_g1_i1.p1  ORF type:complete len:296 (-),score=45.12 TRINITY_DN26653_c0_g1_i1:280-1167(-)
MAAAMTSIVWTNFAKLQANDPVSTSTPSASTLIFSRRAASSQSLLTRPSSLCPRRSFSERLNRESGQLLPSRGEPLKATAQQLSAGVEAPPTPSPGGLKAGLSLVDTAILCVGFSFCAVCAAVSMLALSAISTLKSIRKAADSVEKLVDAARDELPSTMAAVRLSGMEISDLTMELSDLSHEISEGVRSSTRAVKTAEDGLRRVRTLASAQTLALLQERAAIPTRTVPPAVVSVARSSQQALVRGRQAVRDLSLIRRVGAWVGGFLSSQWQRNNLSAASPAALRRKPGPVAKERN